MSKMPKRSSWRIMWEAHGLLEVIDQASTLSCFDADEPAGVEELDTSDLAGEVVAEHEPDAERAGDVGVPAPLEEYDPCVMVWNSDERRRGSVLVQHETLPVSASC